MSFLLQSREQSLVNIMPTDFVTGPEGTWDQGWKAGKDLALLAYGSYGEYHSRRLGWEPTINRINAELPEDQQIENPAEVMLDRDFLDKGYDQVRDFAGVSRLYDQDIYDREVDKVNALIGTLNSGKAPYHPGYIKSVDSELLDKEVAEHARKVEAHAHELSNRSGDITNLSMALGNFHGLAEDIITDPNFQYWAALGLLRFGKQVLKQTVGRSIKRVAITEAFFGMTYEAYYQSGVMNWRQKAGLDYDYVDFMAAVATAGVATGVLTAGTLKVSKWADKGNPKKVKEATEKIKNLSDEDADNFESALKKEKPVEGDLFKFANNQQRSEKQVLSEGVDSDIENIEAAIRSDLVVAGEDVPVHRPPSADTTPPPDIHHGDNLDGTVYRFDPDDIEVDAKTMQFKIEGADEFGVTERLQGITKWDNTKSGQVVVYEYADGRRVIADGHQRLALAKRLKANDPNADIKLYGSILREADGITPQEAMVTSALKNISEGTGTVVDAARVLRVSPDRIGELPPRSQFVKTAREISEVSDEAWGLIINELVPPNQGAIIGRLVSDKSKHFAIARLLADLSPENVTQAEAIVRQAMTADFATETQVGLFGAETRVASLYAERAKVLDSTMKWLQRDKTVFKSLAENASRIESEGNILATKANVERGNINAQAKQILQAQATKKGPISDALNAAAKEYKDTKNLKKSTSGFVDAIRGAVERGDFEGATLVDEGRNLDVAEEINRVAASPARSRLNEFDDPRNGKGKITQGERLEADAREKVAAEEAFGFEAEKAKREQIRPLLERSAPIDEIEQHPVVIEAMEKAKAVPETHLSDGFGTDAWRNTREFNFGGETVVGYDAGASRLYEDAKALGWKDDGKKPEPVLQERKATIIMGPPASGKSVFANQFAQSRKSAIIDPDEAKKVLPEYGDGLGANATHVESKEISNLVQRMALQNGDNIVIPTVGHNMKTLSGKIEPLQKAGYDVEIINMYVSPDEFFRRAMYRFINNGRLVDIPYVKSIGLKPSQTFDKLIKQKKVNKYASISNEGPKEAVKNILKESSPDLLEGVNIRLGRGGGEVRQRDGGVGRQELPIEQTIQGTQRLIEGVEPITQATRAQEALDAPITGTQRPMDEGLFDLGAREQTDLLDAIPTGERIDPDTGERVATTQTLKEIITEIDADKRMLDRFEGCV